MLFEGRNTKKMWESDENPDCPHSLTYQAKTCTYNREVLILFIASWLVVQILSWGVGFPARLDIRPVRLPAAETRLNGG